MGDRYYNSKIHCCRNCQLGIPCGCIKCIQGKCENCPCGRARIKHLEEKKSDKLYQEVRRKLEAYK